MIYIASKTKHADEWRSIRDNGMPINSTWIDEAGKGETKSFTDLWMRCIDEVEMCEVLIVYKEPGEVLKGALVEVGAALATGSEVLTVGFTQDEYSFLAHPNCIAMQSISHAFSHAHKLLEDLNNA